MIEMYGTLVEWEGWDRLGWNQLELSFDRSRSKKEKNQPEKTWIFHSFIIGKLTNKTSFELFEIYSKIQTNK